MQVKRVVAALRPGRAITPRTHLDPFNADRYDSAVARTEALLETLRELLGASNPGLVTRGDFADLEDRVAELEELLDEIEERLAEAAGAD